MGNALFRAGGHSEPPTSSQLLPQNSQFAVRLEELPLTSPVDEKASTAPEADSTGFNVSTFVVSLHCIKLNKPT